MRIEELTLHSKGNTQASKANQVAAKKIETMADRVAAMAATFSAQSGPANMSSGVYVNPGQGSNQSNSSLKKSSPHLVVDLSECAPSLNERPLKEIRQHLQASIKRSDRIKGIEIRAMSRDNRKDHRYFVFVSSQAHEDGFRVHLDDWLPKSFPKAQVQSTTFYPIRVDIICWKRSSRVPHTSCRDISSRMG